MPEPMIARGRIIGALAVCVAAFLVPAVAHGQRPVCPPPALDQPYYQACNIGGQFATIRFLSDFAIDHLFHTDPRPFPRRPFELLRMFDAGWLIGDEHPLAAYLQHLNPIQFTRLDTATGSLKWDISEADRSFTTTIQFMTQDYEISWQLPRQIVGGYWRTPGVLEVALWEEQRPNVTINSPGGVQLQSEISCLVVSVYSVRLVTTSTDIPDILIRFDQCP